jgi:hypothetical protein
MRNGQSERKPKFDKPKREVLNIGGICKSHESSRGK